jgi:hypothetical protein
MASQIRSHHCCSMMQLFPTAHFVATRSFKYKACNNIDMPPGGRHLVQLPAWDLKTLPWYIRRLWLCNCQLGKLAQPLCLKT